MSQVSTLENRRAVIQARLDSAKHRLERNKMGQYGTPISLAIDILQHVRSYMSHSTSVRFIDPAIGTGAFYSALLQVFPTESISSAVGYEIDPHYGLPAAEMWSETALDLRIADFTLARPPESQREKVNLLICNPPYVRHHHMSSIEKDRLRGAAGRVVGADVSGLAGLYCYFLYLSHGWIADGGLGAWLIPSEFMDVNYGASIRRYLVDKVTLLHVHRFDSEDLQFDDALVSSAVVLIRMGKSPRNHEVRMTFGGSLRNPRLEKFVRSETLSSDLDWIQHSVNQVQVETSRSTLADHFRIQRGLATGNNRYFILSGEEIERRELPWKAFRPILPSPRYVQNDEIFADPCGAPRLSRRCFVLDCDLSEDEISAWSRTLKAYLDEGREQGVPEGYLCRHRSPWYSQERRPATPFVCSYIGRATPRKQPFRFILNHSQATAPNSYLMLYPTETLSTILLDRPELKRTVWTILQGISSCLLIGRGRVYGGGLHKIEPGGLGRVPAPQFSDILL